jgi:hypothetical protein
MTFRAVTQFLRSAVEFSVFLFVVFFGNFVLECLLLLMMGQRPSTEFLDVHVLHHYLPLAIITAAASVVVSSQRPVRSMALTVTAGFVINAAILTFLLHYTDFDKQPLFDAAYIGDAWEAVHPPSLLEHLFLASIVAIPSLSVTALAWGLARLMLGEAE